MARPAAIPVADGVDYFPGFLDRAEQEALREEFWAILTEAPLYRARMPRTGKPFSVRMSNCGPLGWVSDERGYRYQPTIRNRTALAADARPARRGVAPACAGCAATGSLSHQLLQRQGKNGPAPGS